MTKFKVGDKFIPRKPKNSHEVGWVEKMDEYEGQILIVFEIAGGWLRSGWWLFNPDWCEKVDNNYPEITSNSKQVPDIDKTIDWEQRRYEIARDFMTAQINSLYLKRKEWNYTDEARYAVNAADVLINQLQKTSEN